MGGSTGRARTFSHARVVGEHDVDEGDVLFPPPPPPLSPPSGGEVIRRETLEYPDDASPAQASVRSNGMMSPLAISPLINTSVSAQCTPAPLTSRISPSDHRPAAQSELRSATQAFASELSILRKGSHAAEAAVRAMRSRMEAERSRMEAERSRMEAKRSRMEAMGSRMEAKRSRMEAKLRPCDTHRENL